MTSDQRERLRIILQQTILVRRGEIIDEALAEERARNAVTIVELFINELREEVTWKGPPPPDTAVGTVRAPSRYYFDSDETMERHASRIIK